MKINKTKKVNADSPIVIDAHEKMIFKSEDELLKYFKKEIDTLESEYLSIRKEDDFSDKENASMQRELELTLDSPDFVWKDEETFKQFPIYHMIRQIEVKGEPAHYIACVYLSENSPTFIFLHFATRDEDLLANFSRGEMIYDVVQEACAPAAIDGDGLEEGDLLAIGLFQAMMKIRAATDIPLERFQEFAPLREEAVETADEIWRTVDLSGNTLVSFIKEFPENEELSDLTYVAVTLEDANSNVHSLLYSFPTTDKSLVDRYRRGENLQAEEVSQESSH